jgi:hypothetical protein
MEFCTLAPSQEIDIVSDITLFQQINSLGRSDDYKIRAGAAVPGQDKERSGEDGRSLRWRRTELMIDTLIPPELTVSSGQSHERATAVTADVAQVGISRVCCVLHILHVDTHGAT